MNMSEIKVTFYSEALESNLSGAKHVTGGHAQGGTCIDEHFGGAKALFCYVNQKPNGSAGGQTMQNF